jgi:hypothetical protein
MIPGNNFAVELAAHTLRRRALAASLRRRAANFTPPEWPPSRGPTPNPRHR